MTNWPSPDPTWMGLTNYCKCPKRMKMREHQQESPMELNIKHHNYTTTITAMTHTHQSKYTSLPYPTLPLPPLAPAHIQITIFNNRNGLKTEEPRILEATMESYPSQQMTIQGIIETQQNWQNYKKTTVPLCTALKCLQGTQNTKITMSHYREDHTA